MSNIKAIIKPVWIGMVEKGKYVNREILSLIDWTLDLAPISEGEWGLFQGNMFYCLMCHDRFFAESSAKRSCPACNSYATEWCNYDRTIVNELIRWNQ